MYLNYLEKNEKLAFLKLTHIIANADNNICENEKIIIGSYCNEMGIENIPINIDNESVDSLSKEFKSLISKKVTILELMSVINANNEFKDSEKIIIDNLINHFELNDKFLKNIEIWSKSLMTLIDQGTNLVLED